MIFTELTFLDSTGYETKKSLRGDKVDFVINRLNIKKTKNKLVMIETYSNLNFETIRAVCVL